MPYQKVEGYNGDMYGDNRRPSNEMMLQSKRPLEDYLPGAPTQPPSHPHANHSHSQSNTADYFPPLPTNASVIPGSVTITVADTVADTPPQYSDIPPEYAGMSVVESYTPPTEAQFTPGDPGFKDSFDLIEGVDGTVTATRTNHLHPVVLVAVLLLIYFSLKYWGDALDGWLTTTFFAGQTPSWKASVIMAVIFTIIIIGVLLIFKISVPVFTRELSLS